MSAKAAAIAYNKATAQVLDEHAFMHQLRAVDEQENNRAQTVALQSCCITASCRFAA